MRFDFFRRPSDAPACPIEAREPAVNEAMHVESGGFVTYALLPDAQKRVKGYKLAWRMAHGIAWRRADRFREPEGAPLLRRDEPHPPKTCWRLGRLVLFFDMTVEGLNLKELQALPPKNVVLCIDLDDLMNAGIRSTLLRLRAQGYAQGYGFVLRGAEALPRDVELCAIITCVDVGDGRPEAAGDAGHSVYCHTHGDLAGLHRLRARRLDVFRPGRPPTQAGATLQPESVLIVRLMRTIRRDEDLRTINATLEHDAALTYRLLRHISSHPALESACRSSRSATRWPCSAIRRCSDGFRCCWRRATRTARRS